MPDIVTSQVFSDGEKGITATKMNNIIANSVIQPDFVTAKPSSSTLDPTDQLLEVKGAGTYARITGSQLISSVSAQVDATPQIYSVRLRSFNSLGNPNFEVTQRNCGSLITPPAATATFIEDRWRINRSATTGVVTAQKQGPAVVAGSAVFLPGTNFLIANGFLRITVTTQQASLAATDYILLQQIVEGPALRELWGDVHSVSLLVRSSVANLTFGLLLRDGANQTLPKLCSLGAANTWTLITLPNLPVWPSGAFSITPGVQGYILQISLAAGITYTASANDTWQTTANLHGANGQGNFLAQPVNSTVDFAFCSHEPGALCTTPIDRPFGQNLDGDMGCLRYYQKSYAYGTTAGVVATAGEVVAQIPASQQPYCYVPFKKTMAKIPTVAAYSTATGAINNVRDGQSNTDRAISAALGVGDSSYDGFGVTTPNASSALYAWHYTADTGW